MQGTSRKPAAPGLGNIPWPGLVAMVGAAYFIAARLGLLLASVHGSVSPVWPATGVAIGALLLGGIRLWPGVALGAFAANVLTPVSILAVAGITVGNTLEALTGAWIVGCCVAGLRRSDLEYLAEPAGLALASAAAPVVSATCGVLTLMVAGEIQGPIAGTLWLTWWVGDALGALMVAPLMIAVREAAGERHEWTVRGAGRVVTVMAAIGAVCWVVFYQPSGGRWLFVIFPVLLLAVAWFGSVGVKFAAFLVTGLGISAAFAGSGPFTSDSLNENLLHLQLFLTSVGTAALLLPLFRDTGRLLLSSVLLGVAWALSGWLFASLHQDRLRLDAARFEALATDGANRIRQRLTTYEDSLRGGAGLFVAAKSVGRAEWHAYVEALNLQERYPGIEALGVVFPVRLENLDAFVAAVRADGQPDFTVKRVPAAAAGLPDDLASREHLVVTYLEPLAANQPALGLDNATEINRDTAAEEARDTGEPRLTGRITLLQDPSRRPAFLLFVPLFRPGLPLQSVAQRRAALTGWVEATCIAERFLQGALGPDKGEIGLQFFEGPDTNPAHLLYSTPGSRGAGATFAEVTRLDLGGQVFTAGWTRGPAFVTADPSSAIWAATSSALVTLLMVGLVVSLHTVTRRARALAAERTGELVASEERFRLLVENVLDYGIFALDRTGRVATWNSGAERNSGYTAREIIGRHFSVFCPKADVEIGRPERELAAAMATGRAESEGWQLRRDGSRFWAHAVLTALHQPDGTHVGFVQIVRDITARKQLEANLAEARDAALEASRLKSEFLATMSHEIRTPMNGIIGMSGLLMDSDLLPEQRTMGHVIQTSAERLLSVIDDILDYSHLEAGRVRLEAADFDLQQLVDETLALAAPQAHEKGLELTGECDPALTTQLTGDANRIRQVLAKLVGNAIKFTEKGEVAVSANLVRRQPERVTIRLNVRDTGGGIPGEIRGRLFQPFTPGDGTATRRHGGSGLGLAISRQLVRLMGGRIDYESTAGQGTTFWFELDLPTGAPRKPGEAMPVLPPGLRVLVVDDNATNRWILVDQLVRFGLDAKAVADGSTALAWLWTQASVDEPCDLVILDWQMPGISGQQLAGEIRGDAALKDIPLVVLSSAGPLADPAAAAGLGFAAFLVKPVRDAQLYRCLARILGRPAGQVRPATPAGPVRLKLLFVEDNREDQILMRMLFEKTGHSVTFAGNGREALDELARQNFDAVLMDCEMPLMNGYETARRIRSGLEPGVNPRIPIIALTAHVLPGERQKCLSAGMDDYLTKPLRLAAVGEVFLRCGLIKDATHLV